MFYTVLWLDPDTVSGLISYTVPGLDPDTVTMLISDTVSGLVPDAVLRQVSKAVSGLNPDTTLQLVAYTVVLSYSIYITLSVQTCRQFGHVLIRTISQYRQIKGPNIYGVL